MAKALKTLTAPLGEFLFDAGRIGTAEALRPWRHGGSNFSRFRVSSHLDTFRFTLDTFGCRRADGCPTEPPATPEFLARFSGDRRCISSGMAHAIGKVISEETEQR